MTNEVEVGGNTYRIGKLDARTQFHVVRRLAPVLAGTLGSGDPGDALMSIAASIGKLSDEDTNYVIDKSLAVVTRRQDGDRGWASVLARGGGIMFDDITMAVMIQLVYKVLEDDITSFFKGRQSS